MRQLKHHESRLLKKVDFYNWKDEDKDLPILKRYNIENRTEYVKYNQMSRKIRDLANRIKNLDKKSSNRLKLSKSLLDKCYSAGLINSKSSLALCAEEREYFLSPTTANCSNEVKHVAI